MNNPENGNKMARAQMICAGAALSSVIEAQECQEWLRTRDGQIWLAGLRMAIDCGDPEYMASVELAAFEFDSEFQEVAPSCAA